jgi:hypothetical protein
VIQPVQPRVVLRHGQPLCGYLHSNHLRAENAADSSCVPSRDT